jgi:hypothetical protein
LDLSDVGVALFQTNLIDVEVALERAALRTIRVLAAAGMENFTPSFQRGCRAGDGEACVTSVAAGRHK